MKHLAPEVFFVHISAHETSLQPGSGQAFSNWQKKSQRSSYFQQTESCLFAKLSTDLVAHSPLVYLCRTFKKKFNTGRLGAAENFSKNQSRKHRLSRSKRRNFPTATEFSIEHKNQRQSSSGRIPYIRTLTSARAFGRTNRTCCNVRLQRDTCFYFWHAQSFISRHKCKQSHWDNPICRTAHPNIRFDFPRWTLSKHRRIEPKLGNAGVHWNTLCKHSVIRSQKSPGS